METGLQDRTTPAAAAEPLRFGHASRLNRDTREVTILVLAQLLVFVATLFNDELIAALVEDRWFPRSVAERCELIYGMALLICWGALTSRLVAVVRRATMTDLRSAKTRERDERA